MQQVADCHICEVPEPKGIEEIKARIAFIANVEKGSVMWEHVVAHVAQARPKGRRKGG